MEKVAVFPVPDCAWAITSLSSHKVRGALMHIAIQLLTLDNGENGTSLNG